MNNNDSVSTNFRTLFYYHVGPLWGLGVQKNNEKYTDNYDLNHESGLFVTGMLLYVFICVVMYS
jgi:hypothetical protein